MPAQESALDSSRASHLPAPHNLPTRTPQDAAQVLDWNEGWGQSATGGPPPPACGASQSYLAGHWGPGGDLQALLRLLGLARTQPPPPARKPGGGRAVARRRSSSSSWGQSPKRMATLSASSAGARSSGGGPSTSWAPRLSSTWREPCGARPWPWGSSLAAPLVAGTGEARGERCEAWGARQDAGAEPPPGASPAPFQWRARSLPPRRPPGRPPPRCRGQRGPTPRGAVGVQSGLGLHPSPAAACLPVRGGGARADSPPPHHRHGQPRGGLCGAIRPAAASQSPNKALGSSAEGGPSRAPATLPARAAEAAAKDRSGRPRARRGGGSSRSANAPRERGIRAALQGSPGEAGSLCPQLTRKGWAAAGEPPARPKHGRPGCQRSGAPGRALSRLSCGRGPARLPPPNETPERSPKEGVGRGGRRLPYPPAGPLPGHNQRLLVPTQTTRGAKGPLPQARKGRLAARGWVGSGGGPPPHRSAPSLPPSLLCQESPKSTGGGSWVHLGTARALPVGQLCPWALSPLLDLGAPQRAATDPGRVPALQLHGQPTYPAGCGQVDSSHVAPAPGEAPTESRTCSAPGGLCSGASPQRHSQAATELSPKARLVCQTLGSPVRGGQPSPTLLAWLGESGLEGLGLLSRGQEGLPSWLTPPPHLSPACTSSRCPRARALPRDAPGCQGSSTVRVGQLTAGGGVALTGRAAHPCWLQQ